MRFTLATISALAAAVLAAPSPAPALQERQVEWHAVGELHSGGGCTSENLIFADPIWGPANNCRALDRSGNNPPIISYKALSIGAGCNVRLFYDDNCSVPASGFNAELNGCVQGTQPFESAIVNCPA